MYDEVRTTACAGFPTFPDEGPFKGHGSLDVNGAPLWLSGRGGVEMNSDGGKLIDVPDK